MKDPKNSDKLASEARKFADRMTSGEKDFQQMDMLLKPYGGIRPASEMAAFMDALPALNKLHSAPARKHGATLLECAVSRGMVTNQSERLIRQFNETAFIPRNKESSQYFLGLENRFLAPVQKFGMKPKVHKKSDHPQNSPENS